MVASGRGLSWSLINVRRIEEKKFISSSIVQMFPLSLQSIFRQKAYPSYVSAFIFFFPLLLSIPFKIESMKLSLTVLNILRRVLCTPYILGGLIRSWVSVWEARFFDSLLLWQLVPSDLYPLMGERGREKKGKTSWIALHCEDKETTEDKLTIVLTLSNPTPHCGTLTLLPS